MEHNEHTQYVARDWKDSRYYEMAEEPAFMALFWGERSPFVRMFRQLDLNNVVELACGHGRHVPQYLDRAGRVTLVDVNKENIEWCQKRLGSQKKLQYYLNSGSDLKEIASGSATSIFCYDAMVHFELFDVAAYLREAFRILVPGGMALFHHSNFSGIVGLPHNSNHDFGWRNYMTVDLFTHLAMRAGLKVAEQVTMEWGGRPNQDGLTLMRKPS